MSPETQFPRAPAVVDAGTKRWGIDTSTVDSNGYVIVGVPENSGSFVVGIAALSSVHATIGAQSGLIELAKSNTLMETEPDLGQLLDGTTSLEANPTLKKEIDLGTNDRPPS